MARTKTKDQLILALIRKLNADSRYDKYADGKHCYRNLTRASVQKDFGVDLNELWKMPSADRAWIDKSVSSSPAHYQIGYRFGRVIH